MKILKKKFYSRDVKIVAKELLGKILVHKTDKGIKTGMIVETEAYGGKNDPASHAYKKITNRNKIMFGEPGRAYIYLCYGNHWLFNIKAEKKGIPGAVLIRALQPLKGIDLMKKERKMDNIKNLTNGPGKLTAAFNITGALSAIDLTNGNLFVAQNNKKFKFKIIKKPRIGIIEKKPKYLRFYIKNNPYVSFL